METKPKPDAQIYYENYYSKKGKYRNDILMNHGVLFQSLALRKSLVEALRTLPISKDFKILDVGSGNGASEAFLQLLMCGLPPERLYGIDIIAERIEQGRHMFPNMNLTCGDAANMKYESCYFDMVLESTMFGNLADDISRKIAAEMLRVTKPKGYIMLIDWRYDFWRQGYNAVSKKRIGNLFDVGAKAKVHCAKNGALLPPIGRFLSAHASPLYFLVQKTMPFLAAQVTTVLQKES
ncbi:MAG: class I SAM-dependent methyltransferase [Elusimicrobiales bacterium]|nr:class I SAM-dependent methyltransferase [Elusimicrobiales bacterium]